MMKGLFDTIEAVGHVIKVVIDKFNAFAKTASGAKLIQTVMSSLWTVLKAVGVAVLAVVGFFIGVVVVATSLALTIWTVIGSLIAFGATLTSNIADAISTTIGFFAAIGDAVVNAISGAIQAVEDWVGGAATAAADFVAGLVQGISNGASAVTGAVKGLADGAVGAFKNALGIHSPSAVMMGLGENTGTGFAEGVSSTAGDTYQAATTVSKQAVAGAAAPPAAAGAPGQTGAAGKDSSSSGGKGGGATVTFEAGSIVIDGAGKSAADIGEEMLSLMLERFALQAGL
jgi:phage-related protein